MRIVVTTRRSDSGNLHLISKTHSVDSILIDGHMGLADVHQTRTKQHG